MGGSAFGRPGGDGLTMQRLTPAVYARLKQHCSQLLLRFYRHCACPIEAPEKTSHGDLDLLVSEPLGTFTVSDIAAALQARRYNHDKANPTTNFAVPMPADTQSAWGGDGVGDGAEERLFQLDVHVCNPERLEWTIFFKSYGDMWNLLGSSIRPFGLTASEKGLHVCIPELEAHNRKESLLFLTTNPAETLDFLGLSNENYTQGFRTLHDLFEWVTTCRFFGTERYALENLRQNDRRRMVHRIMYRQFVEEHLSTFRDSARPEVLGRQEVLDEALERFGKRREYEALMAKWRTAKEYEEMWNELARFVQPEGEERLVSVVRMLRRWVKVDGARVCVRQTFEEVDEDEVAGELLRLWKSDPSLLQHWLAEHWDQMEAKWVEWVEMKRMQVMTTKMCL